MTILSVASIFVWPAAVVALLVACILRWRGRRHWTTALLICALSLNLVAMAVQLPMLLQWFACGYCFEVPRIVRMIGQRIAFLSSWLGLAAQGLAAVGVLGIIVGELRREIPPAAEA